MRKNNKKTVVFLVSMAVAIAVGALGALISKDAPMVYGSLEKPSFAPPSWLFGVVWSILFLLMGVSSYLIYISDCPHKKNALTIYAVQLFLNVLWSVLFFMANLYAAAFFVDIVLLGAIAAMIVTFEKCSKPAAYLQIPYFLWVAFAGYLNLFIVLLN